MAETDLPNPSSTIVFFLLATLCFTFFTMFSISQAKTYETIENANNNNIINAVYILFLIVGSYFINATISKSMCSQSIQWGYILMITLLPWTIIFISLHFILKLFPGWITPFANTIGYIVIGFLGLQKVYDNIFINPEQTEKNTPLFNAIANMNNNKMKFINQISSDLKEFNTFFDGITDTLKKDVNIEQDKLKLYQLLVIKQVLGKIVWYILAGILISSISYNLVINMACEKSLEEIKKDFDSAREESEQLAESQQTEENENNAARLRRRRF